MIIGSEWLPICTINFNFKFEFDIYYVGAVKIELTSET